MRIDYFVYNRRSLFEPFLNEFAKGINGRQVTDLVLHIQGSNLVFEIVSTDSGPSDQKVFVEQANSLNEIRTKINEILDLHKGSDILIRTANLPDSQRYVAAVIVQSVTPALASTNAEPTTPTVPEAQAKAKARQNKKGTAQTN